MFIGILQRFHVKQWNNTASIMATDLAVVVSVYLALIVKSVVS